MDWSGIANYTLCMLVGKASVSALGKEREGKRAVSNIRGYSNEFHWTHEELLVRNE